MTTQKPPKLNPSSLPYISKCVCWERRKEPPTPQMLRGTNMDAALRTWIENPKSDFGTVWGLHPKLTGEEVEAIQWAKDAILEKAGSAAVAADKGACRFKMMLSIPARQEVLVSGEMDAFCQGQVFDLKSGEPADYFWQLVPYAVHAFNEDPELKEVQGHLVYCDKRDVVTYTFERNATLTKLRSLALLWSNPNKQPTPGDACKRCVYRTPSGSCSYSARALR